MDECIIVRISNFHICQPTDEDQLLWKTQLDRILRIENLYDDKFAHDIIEKNNVNPKNASC